MMSWLLILTLTFNGQTHAVPWALTASPETCALTGTAVAGVIEANTAVAATFTCVPQVSA